MTTPAPRPAPPADTAVDPSADDGCYRALQARDARFDGRFFVGVTSTGTTGTGSRVATEGRVSDELFARIEKRFGKAVIIDLLATCGYYATLGLGLNVVVGLAGLLDLGFVASFSGIVTFKKSEAIRAAATVQPIVGGSVGPWP